MMQTSRRRTVLVTAAAIVGIAIPASAYWSVAINGTAQGSAASGGLSAPTTPTRTVNNDGTVTVGWSLPSSQLSGAQYQVTRSSDSAVVATVASNVTSYTDNTVPAGTSGVTYSIRAVLGTNWTSSAVTTAAATTPTPTLTVAVSPSTVAAGSATAVTTLVAKNSGTTEVTYSGSKTIDWSGLTSSPSGAGPSYPASAVTFVAGVATLTPASSFNVTPYNTADSSLVATDHAMSAVTGSASLTVNPAAASQLEFGTQPSGATAGSPFTAQPTVKVLDQYGNLTSSSASVSLAIGTNPSSGALTCTVNPKAASNGVATFAGCAIDKAGTGYTLTASSDGLTSATSSTFDVASASVTNPTITSPTSAAPQQLHRGADSTFTILGTGFQSGATVTLLDTTYTVVTTTVNSATSITVKVHDGYSGDNGNHATDLTVTNPDGGQATSSNAVNNKG